MAGFFKSFGKGILYVLVLPFLLAILALYGVIGLLVFVFMTFKGLILFFTGRTLFGPLPEDEKAQQIIKANTVNLDPDAPENQPKEGHVALGPSYHDTAIGSNDPFYVPEYLKSHGEDVDLTAGDPNQIEHREVNQINYNNQEEMSEENIMPQQEENLRDDDKYFDDSNMDDDDYDL